MYVVVWHRNHVGILSAYHLVNNGYGLYSYDFTTNSSQFYGGTNSCVEVEPEIWGMASGDVNADGEIDMVDKNLWETEAGKFGYLSSDLNLNTHVDNIDKTDLWLKNDSINCYIPD